MTSISDPSNDDSNAGEGQRALYVPDVGGLSLLDAALAYAEAGWYVLPIQPGTKRPANGFQFSSGSTRDPVRIRQIWGRRPEFGVGLHPGRSGAIVFDLDRARLSELPAELSKELSRGACQRSRRADSSHPDRGHFLFLNDRDYGNSAGAFAPYGEVRGRNGVIVVAPTPHTAPDGEYRWANVGVVPRLPNVLRKCLNTASATQAAPLTSVELERFLDTYTASTRPDLLSVPLDKFTAMVAEGVARHEAMRDGLAMAYRDAMAGLYPAREATEQLRAAFDAAFRPDDGNADEMKGRRDRPEGNEFQKLAEWAAAAARGASDGEIARRRERVIGSDKDAELARIAFGPGGAWNPDTPGTIAHTMAKRHRRADPPMKVNGRQFTESLASIKPKKVDWLWWPWIPRGKLTIFEGEPDVGKSTMTLMWAAMVSNGGPWPRSVVGEDESRNEKGLAQPAGVVLVGVEDDLADTVVPRLIAAGADLNRLSTMARARDDEGRPIPFLIPDDVDKLRRAIEEVDARLVVVDPISAFMSDAVKPGSDTANRKALMTLADVAEQTGAAIVLVRHLNKGTGMSAKHRGGGSIAYTALARSVLLAAKLSPSEDRENTEARYGLALTKGNLAPASKTLGYQLVSSPSDPDSPIVLWAGLLDESADQLVGADVAKGDARKAAPARDEAERLIREILAAGPVDAKEVRKMVQAEAGCSEKTVTNAANKIGVVKTAVRVEGGSQIDHWTWALSGRIKPQSDADSA